LIAGPCLVENETIVHQTAEFLAKETEKRNLTFIFKSSYRKANRTSLESSTGIGDDLALQILERIRKEFQIPILTDVHETNEVEKAARTADILQIPAFLSRQTDLIIAAAATGRIINIKKGQFMAPDDMSKAIRKILSTGNNQILLTERGTSFGYHDLVVDFRSFAVLGRTGYPVIFDVTHSLQKPSQGDYSGGTPEYALMMAKAALATGLVDGLFLETHPDPAAALSDAHTQLPLEVIPDFLDACLKIAGLKED
ncbi:MAG: 3-deoxy-8-phosphooctulonate synthase, partial [Candidatus Cloacimonetes bacterium]|nr:3-deoxy-8-phosphooctulonate synthase [Candidatus Cloacimonadota bacterium]